MKKSGRKRCTAGLILIILTVLTGSVVYFVKIRKQETEFSYLRNTCMTGWNEGNVTEMEQAESEPETEGAVRNVSGYDFEKLRETNGDIYAWITVPGTQIDYPVLQSDTDNYYLEKNLDHTKGYPGCIYSNSCNSREFTDLLTVLYGHNMKNGSMFGSLHDYEQEEFFRENREIIIYTEGQCLRYEIVAAVRFSDLYIPDYYGINDDIGRDAFLSEIRQNAAGESGFCLDEAWKESAEAKERYLILSTCVDGHDDLRYLVVGSLAEETAL